MCRPASVFLFFRAELHFSGGYSAHHNAPYKKSIPYTSPLANAINFATANRLFLPAPTPPSPPLSKKKSRANSSRHEEQKKRAGDLWGAHKRTFFLTRRKECRGRTPGQRRRRDRKRARKRKGIVGGGHSGERPLRPRPNVSFSGGGGDTKKSPPFPFPFSGRLVKAQHEAKKKLLLKGEKANEAEKARTVVSSSASLF